MEKGDLQRGMKILINGSDMVDFNKYQTKEEKKRKGTNNNINKGGCYKGNLKI